MRGGVSIVGAVLRGFVVFVAMTASVAVALFIAVTGPPSADEWAGLRAAAGQTLLGLAQGSERLAWRACQELSPDARETLGCPHHSERLKEAQSPAPAPLAHPIAPHADDAPVDRAAYALAGAAPATTIAAVAPPLQVRPPHPRARAPRQARREHAAHPGRFAHALPRHGQIRRIVAHVRGHRAAPEHPTMTPRPASHATAIAAHARARPHPAPQATPAAAVQQAPAPRATPAVVLRQPAQAPAPAPVPHANLAGPEPAVAAAPAGAAPPDAHAEDAHADDAHPDDAHPDDAGAAAHQNDAESGAAPARAAPEKKTSDDAGNALTT
jgi:hypothetical protein